ncbi:MAG: T9SS type A sorting domain-containing protein, partial [Ignavibacteria bacterium]
NAAEAGWNNAMCIKGNNVWFGTNNTRVYYSTNSGTNWSFGATTGTVNGYSVAFNTTGIGFTGQTVAVKSTNGGANWALFTVPGTGTIFGFSNMNNEFWYGMNNVVYASTDNGATFAAQYTNTVTTTVYQSLSFAQANNVIRGWAVAANGVISRYNENMTAITRNENKIPSSYVLSQNYPNPFNPTTNITYSIPKAGNVKLTIFDVLGREVSVLVNEVKSPGTYNVDFNASNIGSGVYFYRIEAGDFSAVKKMVLVK